MSVRDRDLYLPVITSDSVIDSVGIIGGLGHSPLLCGFRSCPWVYTTPPCVHALCTHENKHHKVKEETKRVRSLFY